MGNLIPMGQSRELTLTDMKAIDDYVTALEKERARLKTMIFRSVDGDLYQAINAFIPQTRELLKALEERFATTRPDDSLIARILTAKHKLDQAAIIIEEEYAKTHS